MLWTELHSGLRTKRNWVNIAHRTSTHTHTRDFYTVVLRCQVAAKYMTIMILMTMTYNTCHQCLSICCTKRSTARHHVISTNCAFQFRLFLAFLFFIPLSVAICSFPGQGYNSATGHFVRLVRSPGTVYHWTFVRHLHYQLSKTCSRHIFSHVPTSLTNCFQSTNSEHCTAHL